MAIRTPQQLAEEYDAYLASKQQSGGPVAARGSYGFPGEASSGGGGGFPSADVSAQTDTTAAETTKATEEKSSGLPAWLMGLGVAGAVGAGAIGAHHLKSKAAERAAANARPPVGRVSPPVSPAVEAAPVADTPEKIQKLMAEVAEEQKAKASTTPFDDAVAASKASDETAQTAANKARTQKIAEQASQGAEPNANTPEARKKMLASHVSAAANKPAPPVRTPEEIKAVMDDVVANYGKEGAYEKSLPETKLPKDSEAQLQKIREAFRNKGVKAGNVPEVVAPKPMLPEENPEELQKIRDAFKKGMSKYKSQGAEADKKAAIDAAVAAYKANPNTPENRAPAMKHAAWLRANPNVPEARIVELKALRDAAEGAKKSGVSGKPVPELKQQGSKEKLSKMLDQLRSKQYSGPAFSPGGMDEWDLLGEIDDQRISTPEEWSKFLKEQEAISTGKTPAWKEKLAAAAGKPSTFLEDMVKSGSKDAMSTDIRNLFGKIIKKGIKK